MKTYATIELSTNDASITPMTGLYFKVRLGDVDIESVIDEIGVCNLLENISIEEITDFINKKI